MPNIGTSNGHFLKVLLFVDNLCNLNLRDLKTLLKGGLLIFLVCQQKLCYLCFHEKINNIFYKLSCSQQRRNKNQENVFHTIPVWTLYIRGCRRLCLLSSNSLAVSIYCILLEISKFGLLTFSVELRF